LHSYVQPDTLGIFLYIISFCPIATQPKVVTALRNIVTNSGSTLIERQRAISLLCKIVDHATDIALKMFVVKFMRKSMEAAVEEPYGCLMLKCTVAYSVHTEKLIPKVMAVTGTYLKSSHPCNIAAAYWVLMGLAANGEMIPIDDCLCHLQIHHLDLQEAVLEYLRRHFVERLEPGKAQRLVQVLLTVYERDRIEKVAVMLFHLASLSQFAQVFQNQAVQDQYLHISDDSAADLLQLLIFMMRMDGKVLLHPSIPVYLASILKYGNNQAFVIVCLLLDRGEVTPDLLTKLEDRGVLGMICERVSECDYPIVVKYAARALMRFAKMHWFEAFRGVVKSLADAVIEGGPDAAPCVVTLSLLSKYDQVVREIAETQVGDHLTPFYGISQILQFAQFLHGRIRNHENERAVQ
jgi:hypothetical protein